MTLHRLRSTPGSSTRVFGFLLFLSALCLVAGCRDYEIIDGDPPQIIALKKRGAKVTYGLAGSYSIDLKDTRIGDDDLAHVEELPGVVTLDLSGTRVTDEGLARLPRGPANLTTLALSDTAVTDAGIEALNGLSNLTALLLAGTEVTDEGLALISQQHPRQRSLTLNDCEKITNEGLKSLAQLKGLESISLANCRQITDEGLEHLAAKKGYQMVYLMGTGCSDAGAARFARTAGALMVVNAGGELAGFPQQ